MNGRLLGLTMLAVGLLGYGADPTSSSAASGGSALATTTAAVPQHGRMGDRGTSVEAIQTTLAGYGYTVAIDGVFGPQTERAVKAWQRSNGLEVDGIAGPITLASLGVGEVSVPAVRGEQVPTVAVDTPPVPHSVEEIIRAVWPDDLEDRAVLIAWRESRHVPTAHNYCCHGVFAIYWTIHRGWLAEQGVTSLDQLYDPETNARAALALYYRAGGWSPWSQTNY